MRIIGWLFLESAGLLLGLHFLLYAVAFGKNCPCGLDHQWNSEIDSSVCPSLRQFNRRMFQLRQAAARRKQHAVAALSDAL